jgi:hypothetical protein
MRILVDSRRALACVGTAEDDFGYVVIGRDRAKRPISYYVYSYVRVR